MHTLYWNQEIQGILIKQQSIFLKKEGMGKWEGNDIFMNSFFPLYILKILIPRYNPGLNKWNSVSLPAVLSCLLQTMKACEIKYLVTFTFFSLVLQTLKEGT